MAGSSSHMRQERIFERISKKMGGPRKFVKFGVNVPIHTVNTEIGQRKDWFDVTQLSLNLNKTNFLVFINGKMYPSSQVQIKRVNIDVSSS